MSIEIANSKRVIYDFGMNDGLNLPYYLKKGIKVVGIEANPDCCDRVKEKFSNYINNQQLVVENCVVGPLDSKEEVEFYVHRFHSVLSQFPKPSLRNQPNFRTVKIAQRKASSIIKEHGIPYFVKIDLEGGDEQVLEDFFEHTIIPELLSVEAQKIDIFFKVLKMGYRLFNWVEGAKVSRDYSNTQINTFEGIETYSFVRQSAGPFGEDLKSPWRTQEPFLDFLLGTRMGWKDIHAKLH